MTSFRESKNQKKAIRPWGMWLVLLKGISYKVKKIIVNPGQSLSLQSHQHRSEHWVVVCGRAKIQNGGNNVLLKKGQSAFIGARQEHRLSNPGRSMLEIIEIQNGDYLEEDDIIRYDDKYGRI